nr:immunoglobulin light chain junction region [Macaca mulatta]
CQQGHTFPFTF